MDYKELRELAERIRRENAGPLFYLTPEAAAVVVKRDARRQERLAKRARKDESDGLH